MESLQDLKHKLHSAATALNDLSKVNLKNVNVEDGLRETQDHEIFMSASLQFLQRYILNNIKYQETKRSPENDIHNTNSLRFVSRGMETSYFVLKLKNCEEYIQKMEQEASLPDKILDEDDVIPNASTTNLCLQPVKRASLKFDIHHIISPSNTQTVISVFQGEDGRVRSQFNNEQPNFIVQLPKTASIHRKAIQSDVEIDVNSMEIQDTEIHLDIYQNKIKSSPCLPDRIHRGSNILSTRSLNENGCNKLRNSSTNLMLHVQNLSPRTFPCIKACSEIRSRVHMLGQDGEVDNNNDKEVKNQEEDDWIRHIKQSPSSNLTDEVKSTFSYEDCEDEYS